MTTSFETSSVTSGSNTNRACHR